jgi:hypothetical protein
MLPPTSTFAQVKDAKVEKIEDIHRLLNLIDYDKLIQSITDQMNSAVRSSLPPNADPEVQKVIDKLSELLLEEMRKVDMKTMAVELYDKYFTADDIKRILEFYETPVGKKTIQLMPILTQESMSRGMELGRAAGQKAFARLVSEFPELRKILDRTSGR